MTSGPSNGTPTLVAAGLTLGYGGRTVVEGIDLTIPPGRVTAVVGANACGKSTLLRGLARLARPAGGAVLLDGRAVHRWPARELARVLGILPQAPVAPDGITVRELVRRGRHPHTGWLRPWGDEDTEAVTAALAATGTAELADRYVDELSGGQRQRAWIALALAQRPDVLLLDEPTTYLDLAHAVEVLDLLADLNAERGTTVVLVLHDLNLAARYAHHLVALAAGTVAAQGPPERVVTEDVVRQVFGIDVRVVPDPVTGSPMVVPLGRRARTPGRAGTVPGRGDGARRTAGTCAVAAPPGPADDGPMTTHDEVPEGRTAQDDVPDGGERLAAAGDRIAEARRAADDVARQTNLGDEERRAAAGADDAVGHASGEGAEVTPG